ncbi:outer membrane protein with beta-barrel domain [Arcticibacter pallidicorallinus]|uniref:Outer membrane protein with beta-barrel domain n=1 Tax=Arcticibacter pallidicorallinus TaxID=1259464 RepID=A0A2T0U7J7_9SPHI|nr:porin family protein [Arcticibacter pallidicorallinus]PRY53887.1 outer membrane protein with beta-barrel domain [Arcticibacter pallidicorallinus]
MRKILLLGMVMLGLGKAASAQLPSFNLGLKAGLNFAKLESDFASDENRLGYQAGLWARVGGGGFYVQPEAYLAGKGGEFKSENTEGAINAEGKVRFTTLDVPVLLGTKVGVGPVNVRFMAGPVVSFVLDKDLSGNDVLDAYRKDSYKDQNWGAQFGAGVDISKITLDLRYEAGLTDVSDSDVLKKQNLWQLSLGFKIL